MAAALDVPSRRIMAILWTEDYSEHINRARLREVWGQAQLADHERIHLHECEDCQRFFNLHHVSKQSHANVDNRNAAEAA
jgi:hypothetical protein